MPAAELLSALSTLSLDAPRGVEPLLAPIAQAVGAEKAFALVIRVGVDGTSRLDDVLAVGIDAKGLFAHAALLFGRSPLTVGTWDLAVPAARDRDQLVQPDASGWSSRDRMAQRLYEEVYCRVGLRYHDTLTILDFDGEAVVTTIAVVRRAPFSAAEAGGLAEIAPAVRRRLAAERAVDGHTRAASRVDALLAMIPGAAFLLDARGLPIRANVDGLILLDRGRASQRERLERIANGDEDPGFRVRRLAGQPPAELVVSVRRSTLDPAQRAAILAERWSLTKRQTEVLSLVASGSGNKAIAAELQIAEVTVELHMTALLERSSCENRASLVARFWTAPMD